MPTLRNTFALLAALCLLPLLSLAQTPSPHDLHFDKMPATWDEGIPLGNGLLGCLVWQREPGKIRLALDRADLWDLRPVAEMQDSARFRSTWVQEQLRTGRYAEVQRQFDLPYERDAGPTKIPAAAIEFSYKNTRPLSVHLYLREALCVVTFAFGERLSVFLNADGATGHWRFEHGANERAQVALVPPVYAAPAQPGGAAANSVVGHSLQRLGYPQGEVTQPSDHSLVYEQTGWGGFRYQVAVRWRDTGGPLAGVQEGAWSISAHYPDLPADSSAEVLTEAEASAKAGLSAQPAVRAAVIAEGSLDFEKNYAAHRSWWAGFWQKSSIRLPDLLLEKQWHLEQYKFGSASRPGAPPISLQAVWTADNGQLPPWKGDFHNDLNTQLSYWAAYGANHVEEARVFLDWLWGIRPAAKRFAEQYFGVPGGLNVPGVSTLRGEPMGGWIQYSFSPTVSAWLSQHFWQDWRYTRDADFFREKGQVWMGEAAGFLAGYAVHQQEDSLWFDLPLSTSPEMNDNSAEAYFRPITNFDLALVRFVFERQYELALQNRDADWQAPDAWGAMLGLLPPLATDSTGLVVAPGHPYSASHRHFSHLMAIYPLGLLQFDRDSALMARSVRHLERLGTDWWTGYSYAWMG